MRMMHMLLVALVLPTAAGFASPTVCGVVRPPRCSLSLPSNITREVTERDYKGLHALPSNITRDGPPTTRDYPPSLLTLQGRSLTMPSASTDRRAPACWRGAVRSFPIL